MWYDNFRKIYDQEMLKFHEEGTLVYLILNSSQVRGFVHEVCKRMIADFESQLEKKK